MARPEEKAKSMLNRWLKGQQEEGGSGLKRRRPYMASACKDLNECDKWRGQILRDIGAKVMEIQNSALQEDRIRELNDEINKLMRVKHAWEKQIVKLGGPNYIKQASKLQEDEGEGIWGGGRGGPQYKYFGAARNLPGVKELFEMPKAQKKARRTKHEILKGIDADYFGYRDEDDGVLLKVEAEADEARSAAVREEQEEVLAAKGAVDGEGPAPGGKGKGGEGGSSAHLPGEKATEKSSAVAKKSDLMAKYASEELQQQVQYQ